MAKIPSDDQRAELRSTTHTQSVLEGDRKNSVSDARKSSFNVNLSSEERQTLKSVARKYAPLRTRRRASPALARFDGNFIKGSEWDADHLVPEPMIFLTSGMADLKLRLLGKIAQSTKRQRDSGVSSETIGLRKRMVYLAVEDRICSQIDLALRNDLTDRQAADALCILIGIVLRSGLAIEFSRSEIDLLTRSTPRRKGSEPIHKVAVRKSLSRLL
jgi:hypothetical protein